MDKSHFLNLAKRYWLLLVIVCLFLSRAHLFVTQAIPFNFDHGKDSLAVMHMVTTLSPKLIGPWTSIPGLYFGPGWYYWLALWYLLGGFNPTWGVIGMIGLQVCLIWLAKKHFGWLPALIMGTAPTWLTISSSAWNPFPMPLMSLLILICLEKFRKHRVLEIKENLWQWWLLMGLAAGFGFHFSTAYAIFYPLIILATILFYRLRPTFLQLLVLAIGFGLPFLPQLVFELRHNFMEVNAVLAYLHGGESQASDQTKLLDITTKTLAELELGVFPDIWTNNQAITTSMSLIAKGLFLFSLLMPLMRQKEWGRWWFEMVIWVGLPLLGYTVLHYNIWYVLGMLPVAVLFVADKLERLPKFFLALFIVLLIATPLSQIGRFWLQDKPVLESSRQLLPIKLAAINHIRHAAGNKPFAVYHYVPDIYDFTYQYLYFYQAWHGQKLPTDFSYQPNVAEYMSEKADLLSFFQKQRDNRKPELVFYVVENPSNQEFLQAWWDAQKYGQIVAETPISPEVTIYQATP